MTAGVTDRTPAAAIVRPSTAAIVILLLAALLNSLDRVVMATLIEPIKHEFSLSDAEIGALSGLAFGLAYAVLTLPFARVADVGNRRKLIAIALAAWSALTVTCGLATGFWSLFLARMGVGVGEAAGFPAIHSMMADRFPRERRATASSLLITAGLVGAIGGVVFGGLIADRFGWRMAFWMAGAPGLVVAALGALYLREERTRRTIRAGDLFGNSMWQACRFLLAKRSLVLVVGSYALFMLWLYGSAAWFPAFLMRAHGMSLSDVALWYGGASGAATIVGSLASAPLGARAARADPRWLLRLPVLCIAVTFVLWPAVFLLDGIVPVLGLYFLLNVFAGVVAPFAYAAIYALAGSRNRALAVALLLLGQNLVGLSLGAVTVGAISDALVPSFGAGSLGVALLLIGAVLPVSALLLLAAGRSFAGDAERD